MVRISVSDLNRDITFQTLTKTPDGAGGFTETYTDFITVYGSIVSSGSNINNYQQGIDTDKVGYTLYVRFEDVTPRISWFVKYIIDGVQHLMAIEGIYELNDERKFWKILLIDSKNG